MMSVLSVFESSQLMVCQGSGLSTAEGSLSRSLEAVRLYIYGRHGQTALSESTDTEWKHGGYYSVFSCCTAAQSCFCPQ